MVKWNNKFKTMLIGYILFISLCLISINSVKAVGDPDKRYFDDVVGAYQTPTIKEITVNGQDYKDIVRIIVNPGTSKVTNFYAQDVNNTNNRYMIDVTGTVDKTEYYISLKNGTYRIYVGDATGKYTSFNYDVTVSTSCNDQPSLTGVTGSGSIERCFISYGTKGKEQAFMTGYAVTCADGYVIDQDNFKENNYCDYTTNDLTKYGLSYRFCKKVFNYSCVKMTTANSSTLASLAISSGTLSPAFSPTTTSYTATVNASSVNISATLNNDGSSFVTGYGPRTVSLNYGTNSFTIQVKSSTGNITTYTIKITRPDNRSKVNTLKALSIDGVTMNEAFSPSRTSYTAKVDNSIAKVYINAELTDSRSSFVSGYGPRNVNLGVGTNSILIKVKSETGTTKTYTIKISRAYDDSGNGQGSGGDTPVVPPTPNTDELGLLQALNIQQENINLEPEFDSKTLEYNITVPYEVSTLLLNPVAKDATDRVVVEGNEDLKVEETNVVTISVTTSNDFIRVYTINVIRKGEDLVISNDSSLKELKVEGKDIEFSSDNYNYEIVLSKNETQLEITAVANAETSTVEIIDNENLNVGSKVTIRVMAEDATFTDYVLTITGVDKGTNVFLIIVIVIILVLIIAYTILRILGYKIYFNFSMLSSLFRGKDKDSDDE